MRYVLKRSGITPTGVHAVAYDVESEERALASPRLRNKVAIHATVTIITPVIFTGVAILDSIRNGVAFPALSCLLVMYVLTTLGVTAGFHRHFAHRSYYARPWFRLCLGIAGSMAAQGPVLNWASTHRRHHRYTDKAGDPHSPHIRGNKPLQRAFGLWHSHLGWMVTDNITSPVKYAPDLLRDRLVVFVNRHYLIWVALGIMLPGAACWMVEETPEAFWQGVLWGGFVRLFLVHQAFWLVGSAAHLIGTRVFDTKDQSRNNCLSALINLGEGWHNNHHAFSSSARFGLRWYQVDIGFAFIRLMAFFRAVHDVRQPSDTEIKARALPSERNRRTALAGRKKPVPDRLTSQHDQ